MKHEILYKPSYALAVLSMERGDEIVAEAGTMVSMSSGHQHRDLRPRWPIRRPSPRKFLSGESFFMNTFRADEAGEITLAPPLPGDVLHMDMRNQTIMVTSGAYLACSKAISVDTQWGRCKDLLLQGGASFYSGYRAPATSSSPATAQSMPRSCATEKPTLSIRATWLPSTRTLATR